MKSIWLISIFLILANLAWGQRPSSVSGVVRRGGQPVENAVVSIFGENDVKVVQSSRTTQGGAFSIQLPPGRYRIAAAIGSGRYTLSSSNQTIEIAAGGSVSVELELSLTGSINESVTISADQPQPIDEVSKTVNLITGQEMRERADFALAESLRSIPGLRVQQLGGFGRTATIKTRGLRNQDTAILIDGVRLRDASAITGDASPFLGDITLTSVSRVEVLRGSASSLYGTNAIGGTIDLQTPAPQAGPRGQVSYAAGGLGLHRFRGNISDAMNGGKTGFNAALARTVYTEGIDGDDDAHNTNFQSRVDVNPFSSTTISGRFFVSNAFVRLNTNPDTLGDLPLSNLGIIDAQSGVNFIADENDPDAEQRSRFFNGQLVGTQTINPQVVLRGYYSGLATSRKNNNGLLGPGFQNASTSIFDGAIHTANATIDWTPNSVHALKIGYEFENERFGNEGHTPTGGSNFFTRAAQSSSSLFVQDVVSLADGRLQIAGGFRAQFFNLGEPEFSLTNAPYSGLNVESPPAAYTFDAAASYYFRSTGTKLRTHVGNGYRVPSLYERYGTFFSSFGTPEFVALGDPNLKPERSIAFDGGVEQYLAREKVKLSAAYFYTKLIDTIGFGNVVDAIGGTQRPFGGYVNRKGGTASGGEFSATLKPSGSTDIFASYTLTNSDQIAPQVAGSGVIETLGIPRHQFTLVATQRIKRFWVNADVLVASSYLAPIFSNATFNTYVYRFDGNRRVDLTAGYTFPLAGEKFSLRVFGTVENLVDQEYYENGFRTVERNGRIGVSFGF